MIIIYGANVVGKAIYKVLKKQGEDVSAFIDRELTGECCGLPIYHPSEINKLDKATYVISIMSIRTVVNSLQKQGIKDWVAGGILLGDINVTQNSPDYILDDEKYQIESCRIAHASYLKPDHVFLRSLDIMITERCSLKCKDCSNLMQYYKKPKNFDIDNVIFHVDRLIKNVDRLLEARILGGDPFMHTSWPKIMDYVVRLDKIDKVIVYTNGVIVPKDVSALIHPKVIVYITDYGNLSRSLGKITDLFKKSGVWYKIVKLSDWIDCASVIKHNRTREESNRMFTECVANNLTTLVSWRVFRCPFAANAYQLGITGESTDDYINVFRDGKRDIQEYLVSDQAMSACDFCTSRILANKISPAIQTKGALDIDARTKKG